MFLVVIGICDPDTHTQRHCHLIADFNRLNALQDTEFILDQLFQIFFLKYYKILIFFNFLDDTFRSTKATSSERLTSSMLSSASS